MIDFADLFNQSTAWGDFEYKPPRTALPSGRSTAFTKLKVRCFTEEATKAKEFVPSPGAYISHEDWKMKNKSNYGRFLKCAR